MTEVRPTKPLFQQPGEMARTSDEREPQRWYDREYRVGQGTRRSGYVGAIVANLIVLYVVQNLLNWEVPFITGDWVEVLPALTLSISATLVANIVFLGYDAPWFRRLAQIGLNLLALQATYALYTIFPFDFEPHMVNSMVRLGFLVALFGLVIGIIVDTVKVLTGRVDESD